MQRWRGEGAVRVEGRVGMCEVEGRVGMCKRGVGRGEGYVCGWDTCEDGGEREADITSSLLNGRMVKHE